MGVRSLFHDMGVIMPKPILAHVDSIACLGMAGRKGAGSIRHSHTPCLWLQQVVFSDTVALEKVDRTAHPVHICTKVMSCGIISDAMTQCGFAALRRSSRLAFKGSSMI